MEKPGREADERKRKRREAPEEQLWERIREGRKETYSEAEYRNRDGRHGKPGWRERGRPRKRKRRRSTAEATVRRRQEEEGKEEQRLSSQNPKLKRTKERENSGGQKAERTRQSAVEWKAQRKPKGRGEPEEAAAEIGAGGRRKEIADETNR